MLYQVELVWNREFYFVPSNAPWHADLDTAIKCAKALENMGDGGVVKKTRVVDEDDRVVWEYGKKVKV